MQHFGSMTCNFNSEEFLVPTLIVQHARFSSRYRRTSFKDAKKFNLT